MNSDSAISARGISSSALIVLLAVFGAVPLIWPGDAPWINDEPRLMQIAFEAKQSGAIPVHGLWGSRGVQYGPVPSWIYTALMHVTTDLVQLVQIKALLTVILTALAIVWLSRLLPGLEPWMGSFAFLSPYLWFYSRLLWDNVFLIPLSALTIAAYISFCANRRAWKLWIAALGAILMALTHLMSAPTIAAMAIHAAVFHRTWIARRPGMIAAQMALAALLSSGYIHHILTTPAATMPAIERSALTGWLFPFFGGRFFSAFGLEYFFEANWHLSETIPHSRWIFLFAVFSWPAILIAWAGIWLSARRVAGEIRNPADRGLAFHMDFIALTALIAQCALDGIQRAYGHPHYYNATWFFFLYFFWSAISHRAAVPTALKVGYAVSMAAVLAFLVADMRLSGGVRGFHYGSTLQNQIGIARNLNAFHPDSQILTDVPNYVHFPHALPVIRKIYGFHGTESGPNQVCRIQYLRPTGRTGWLSVNQ